MASSNPRLRVPPPREQLEKARKRRQGMSEGDDASGSSEEEAVGGLRRRRRPDSALPLHLLSFDQMPEWFRRESNPFILQGYRPISGSFRESFRSLYRLHNETVNIYSHLIPAIVFLFGEWSLARRIPSTSTTADFIAFSCFMLTATLCYTFSALYHTLLNHSYEVDHFYHRLDMAGIGIFIVGDIVLGVYLIFWCENLLRNIYWAMIGVFGIVTIITNIHPKLQSHKYRSLRTWAFLATGASVVAPLIHGLVIFGLEVMNKKAFTYTVVAKAGCLLSGTGIYAIRFPESRWPGKFDMCGSSHSMMHILVVCAAVIQMMGYLEALDYYYAYDNINVTCESATF